MTQDIFMYIFSVISIGLLIFLLIKKADIVLTLFGLGIFLLILSMIIGRVQINKPIDVFHPIITIVNKFKNILSSSGFIILLLGGYTAYMTHISANDVIVNVLTKPLLKIKKTSLLIPIVFLLGHLLSLGVPSASTLAIILMATLYPVLVKTGISPLTAAAVIATTATVMPTPLGSDNIAIAETLGMPVTKYVFMYHAAISLPTIAIMTLVHFFWQLHCDKVDIKKGRIISFDHQARQIANIEGGTLYKTVYTILPLLPIILVLIGFIINTSLPKLKVGNKEYGGFDLSVEVVTFISFAIALICEIIRHKQQFFTSCGIRIKSKFKKDLQMLEDYKTQQTIESKPTKQIFIETNKFWTGMGSGISTVALLVAASVFVQGLVDIGLIAKLQDKMKTSFLPGFTLPLILTLFTAMITLLSGSGTALAFTLASGTLLTDLGAAAEIPPVAISIPVQLTGNILRAATPVSAVIIIVSKGMGVTPTELVKRTSVPMVFGAIFAFVWAMIYLLLIVHY